MSSTLAATRLAPRWLHAWSVLTAAATVALLALGAVVTTYRIGMADPIWPTAPWHLALIDWSEPSRGFIIEHAHRLAGYVVGCCVLVLAGGLWSSARRSELKWLGAAALAGVIVQGLLGGFRVVLHARFGTGFAVLHGCFAQIVFSLLVSLAVLTSDRSAVGVAAASDETASVRRWSLLLTALVFVQLLWGALVRHTNGALAQRLHVATAFAVVAAAVWFAHLALASPAARRALGRTLIGLGILLALQILLGIESWLDKYAGVLAPELHTPATIGQASHRIAHVLVGSFILATTVVQTVLLHPLGGDGQPSAVMHAPLAAVATKRNSGPGHSVSQWEGTA